MVRFIVDQWLGDRDFHLYPFTRLRTSRLSGFSRHPQWSKALNREIALLDSLVSTGDLDKPIAHSRYVIKPQIVHTLEKLDIEQQRHRASNRIQWLLLGVALFAAAAAVVQAYAAMVQRSLGK
jgi:hypothetical protein